VPVAVALKLKADPVHNVWLAVGWAVMVAGVLIFTTALLLVTVAGTQTPLLVTSTVYVAASVVATLAIVYVLEVAPPILVPPFFH
jgi:hypothetical protein